MSIPSRALAVAATALLGFTVAGCSSGSSGGDVATHPLPQRQLADGRIEQRPEVEQVGEGVEVGAEPAVGDAVDPS